MNDVYSDYRKSVMKPDEIITRVFITLPAANDHFRPYKLSKRHDLDISTLTAAFWMRLENKAPMTSNLTTGTGVRHGQP